MFSHVSDGNGRVGSTQPSVAAGGPGQRFGGVAIEDHRAAEVELYRAFELRHYAVKCFKHALALAS